MTEQEEILHLRSEHIELQAENAQLRKDLASLTEKVNILLASAVAASVKKDSHNSSMPPSSDFFVPKTKSLRERSGRKSGGQFGHTGHTLKMSGTPDKIIDLKTGFCRNCGTSLQHATFMVKNKRQVIEIPPVLPIYEEYRQYGCNCPNCQTEQIADFPKGVNAPIQYGASVEAYIGYLSVYQYVPFARLQNLFGQVFNLPLSQGTIGNILERTAQKCEGVYQQIKSQIAKSEVVGSDETGAKVNGAKWWIWVWQNVLNTFIVASDNRGSQTVETIWNNALANVILIADRWAAQLKTFTKGNQMCLPHLQRNLTFLEESEKHLFATQFKQLIATIFTIKKQQITKKEAFEMTDSRALEIENRVNDLLLLTIDKEKYPNTLTFQASMLKNRASITTCLYHLEVPPDNNGSERAIRNIKVKQKVSGQFKSGQQAFCVIRSVIDTLRKRGVEVLPSLTQIIQLQPV